MTLAVRFSAEADAELQEAASWYDRHRPGLGLRFLESVGAIVRQIADSPSAGSPVPGVADRAIRRRPLPRFPYHLVYLKLPERIQILAVAHDRRRPAYWQSRLVE